MPPWSRKGDFEPLDADAAAELFELTQERTTAAGLPAYEISNHARQGAESRHNLATGATAIMSASDPAPMVAAWASARFATEAGEFPRRCRRNGHGLAEEALLSPREAAHEALVMGLRLAEGIDLAALAHRLAVDRIVDESAVSRLRDLGLVQRRGTQLTVTPAGRLLLDLDPGRNRRLISSFIRLGAAAPRAPESDSVSAWR